MADDDKGFGPWSKVPVWDGSPLSFRRFKRDVTWWLSSIDLSKTTGYNLAARFLLRQEGIARQRGEEFLPEELAYTPQPMITDPDTNEEFPDPDIAPDYLAGINRLLKAWEEMNGRTALDKRGELRQSFYMDLVRKPSERVSEFCTRFRSLVADLKGEGVNIADSELGWWLRQKIGLDPLRRQLLDTALQGSESYATIESEILRLFRDLHEHDPLQRKLERRPLSIRRMFPGRPLGGAPTSAASTSSRMSSASSWSRPSTMTQRSAMSGRQANITENDDEDEEEAENGGAADEAEAPTLEDVLQAEAEVFAAELQQAEEEGVDQTVLDDYEQGMEQAAETLVTMREARQQLQSVRKDRGYGKAGGKGGDSTFKRSQSNQAEARKASGKHPCFDCGEHGHWSGDSQCKKPGQGLARKKSDTSPKKPMRQVRVTETEPSGDSSSFPMAHSADVVEHALPAHDVLTLETGKGNELLVGEVFGSEALNLEQALLQSFSQGVSLPKQSLGLPPDKELVGALDSACNRTCAGPDWLRGYLQVLKEAPKCIQDLVKMEVENENFRFGNNGVVPSLQRWRLPAIIGNSIVLFWVSLVPVNTLGCLIGRDFLEAVGAVLDFARRTLTCTHIESGLLMLQQMVAGHFMLELLPTLQAGWSPLTQMSGGRWRPVGQDGVVELYFNRVQWLQYKITIRSCGGMRQVEKEHLLVESSLLASHYSFLRSSSEESTSTLPPSTTSARASSPHLQRSCQLPSAHGRESAQAVRRSDRGLEMEQAVQASSRPSTMARSWHLVVALAAAWHSVFALSISQCQELWGLGSSGGVHEGSEELAGSPFGQSLEADESVGFGGLFVPKGSDWIRDGFSGRYHGREYHDDPTHEGSEGCHSARSAEACQDGGSEGGTIPGEGGCDQVLGRTSWWFANLEEGLGQFGHIAPPAGGRQGHGGTTQEQDPWSFGGSDGDPCEQGQQVKGIPRRCFDVLVTSCVGQSGLPSDDKPLRSRSQEPRGQDDGQHATARGKISTDVPTGDGTHGVDSPPSNEWIYSNLLDYGITSGSDHHGRGCSHGRCSRLHPRGGQTDEHRTSSRTQSRVGALPVRRNDVLERDAPRISEVNVVVAGLEQSPSSTSVTDESGKLHGGIKSGLKQMISQAWDKHCRDRVAVSKNRFEVFEVMVAQYEKELQGYMNEVFALEVEFPSPFVTEVYTDTEPVAREARRRGLRAGNSMTLATRWDFHVDEHRRAAKLVLKQTKPYLLVLAFPCGPWSLLMNLNPKVNVELIRAKARELVDFAVEMAWDQLAGGRHFLLENPFTSAAWQVDSMVELMNDDRVRDVVIDQCQFGLKNNDGAFHRKATQLVTSSQSLVSRMLNKRCKGGHVHAPVIGGSKVTRPSGHYPRAFAAAIIQGLQDQFNYETNLLYNKEVANNYEVLAVEENPTSALPVDSDGESSDELVVDKSEDEKKSSIAPAVRQAVYRLHENTGHRSPQRLARALLACGAPKDAILAAKQLKCSVCAERKSPRPQRPASLPQTTVVGSKVHIDLLILEDAFRQTYVVVHVTDSVSRFQAASVIKDKSSLSVIQFMMTLWIPLMGRPETLVADQGREFISHEFEEWCSSQSIFLYHIGVQCPWQNGVAERSGATLKAITGAIVRGHSIAGYDEMAMAVGEATSAYNSDINEEGVSPLQAVTGRQKPPVGDVLAGVSPHLPEHQMVEDEPVLARQIAARETARIAMVRMHFSRGLRKAELARSRTATLRDHPQPGDLCYYWRETKYNPKKQRGGSNSRRKLQLRRWHGPAMLVAIEGQANCFLSHRGQITKCGLEHVRKASPLEQISSGAWEAAIREVIESVPVAEVDHGAVAAAGAEEEEDEEIRDLFAGDPPVAPAASAALLSPSEVVAAIQPVMSPGVSSSMPGGGSTRNPSKIAALDDLPEVLRRQMAQQSGGEVPGSEPGVMAEASVSRGDGGSRGRAAPLQSAVARARSLSTGREARGVKREASQPPDAEAERGRPAGPETSSRPATPRGNFEAMVLSWDQLCNLASSTSEVHPLFRLQAQAELDRRNPVDCLEVDHGSWDGRWSMMCEREWELQKELCQLLPCGGMSHEAMNVQASRKEYTWTKMSSDDRKLWAEAAVKGWQVYVDNEAVQVMSMQRSADVRRELAQKGELNKILRPRFVLTDKSDGLRTKENNLEKKPSARLVVPGFRDSANLEGKLRRDAPTGSRLSQHLLFCLAAWNVDWYLVSGDVKSAFLKGDPYVDRVLYIMSTDERVSPPIPLAPGQLAMVRKGVFGLADAPRQWWLRLSRAAKEHGWEQTLLDGATWLFWIGKDGSDRRVGGIMVAHVDDLLFSGGPEAMRSFDNIGSELGFGSKESNDFVWCGKRIRRAEDKTIRLSMVEYHKNLKEIYLPKARKSDPSAALSAGEAKQLRALLGSLQWLVAQLRFDCAFMVSTLQGEKGTIGTILRANAALKQFQQNPFYEMVFRPVDPLKGGIMVVADAALGNVTLEGSNEAPVLEKVYSQACYFVLLADQQLLSGGVGYFNVIDSRSHRIPRVCRSTYAAETLSTEEAFDIGRLCRGLLASVHGRDLYGKKSEIAMDSIPMVVVVDAKDVHDKSNSDTPSYGAQKSLAFTVSWMRSELRRPNTSLRWTSTENMWCDGGTKLMDLSHMRRILDEGRWSISYCPSFVKQVYKAAKSKPAASLAEESLGKQVGEAMAHDDALVRHLMKLGENRGWHHQNGMGINVAFNARSFRTPEPRFSASLYPLRSSYARLNHGSGQCEWRKLECGVRYSEFPNQHALIGLTVPVLVSIFHNEAVSL